jgi:hypothetical protein
MSSSATALSAARTMSTVRAQPTRNHTSSAITAAAANHTTPKTASTIPAATTESWV